MQFKRTRRGIEVKVDEVEAAVLARCAADLIELVDDGDTAKPADPLEAVVGLASEPVARPDDPALARLFPDAYPDDEAAAGEFRRLTQPDLRAGKRAAAANVLTSLPPGGGTVTLDPDAAQSWLGFLNDLRLVLGTRLGVTEDTELWSDDDAQDDLDAHARHVYGWLGWLQESLLAAMIRRTS